MTVGCTHSAAAAELRLGRQTQPTSIAVAIVLGTVAEFRVVTLAGRNAAIALILDKSCMGNLTRDGRQTGVETPSR